MAAAPRSMWMYDLAREQAPSREFLARLARVTVESGYDSLGLYLEHRFAYPSASWAAGVGAVSPEDIGWLRVEFPELKLIPFVNLLGHMEGFLYAEEGRHLAEERLKGLQACPSNPETAKLARGLLEDAVRTFEPEWIHLGGDETKALGQCPSCAERVSAAQGDGKAALYGEHFGPLLAHAASLGCRPAIWGDMLLSHPAAASSLPQETLLFDWQYFDPFEPTCTALRNLGFEVIACPTLHTYNAIWLHRAESRQNLADAIAARDSGLASGVCLTTWECGLFGNYETLIPEITQSGATLVGGETAQEDSFEEWALLMSNGLAALGGSFAHGKIRSSLKCRLLLYQNPFLAWLHHAEEFCGPIGERALTLAAQAIEIAPTPSTRGLSVFLQKAIQFVVLSEGARLAYREGQTGEAIAKLSPARQIFEELERTAIAASLNAGGSLADPERCRAAKRHVEVVLRRIKDFGDRSLGYLPAWEVLTHPRFIPHDQGCWWIVNRWADE